MPTQAFQAFKAELEAVKEVVSNHTKKTIRDDKLLERIRLLYLSWANAVRPGLEPLIENKKGFFKLNNELEKLAQLTSKYKLVSDYLMRIRRALAFAKSLVLILPPSGSKFLPTLTRTVHELFLPDIPDVPKEWVPNSIVGWRAILQSFLQKYPFDRSVFIMVRYRDRNKDIVSAVKRELNKNRLNGILASDHNLTDDLYNPVACLLACSRGIAIFDKAERTQMFNPNVAYELGMMHLLGRQCLILKHKSLVQLHTDILMKLYKPYISTSDARSEVKLWLESRNS